MSDEKDPFETRRGGPYPAPPTHQVLYVRRDNPTVGMSCIEFADRTFRRLDTMQEWAPDDNWQLEERRRMIPVVGIPGRGFTVPAQGPFIPAPGGALIDPWGRTVPNMGDTTWPPKTAAPAGPGGLDDMQLEGLSEFASAMAAQLAPDDPRKQALITEGMRALWFKAMLPASEPRNANPRHNRRLRSERYMIHTGAEGTAELWDFEVLKDITCKVEFNADRTLTCWTGKSLANLQGPVAEGFYNYLKSLDTGLVF